VAAPARAPVLAVAVVEAAVAVPELPEAQAAVVEAAVSSSRKPSRST